MMRIYTMETTLADFAGRYTPDDRLVLLSRLDQLGLTYIDAGSSGAPLSHSRLCCHAPADAPAVIVTEQDGTAAITELKSRGREVIYHVDDFFDAFDTHRRSALSLLKAARQAGADILSLGGSALPRDVASTCAEVRKRFTGIIAVRPLGDFAAAAALEAIYQGCTLIAGPASMLAAVAACQDRLGRTLIDVEQLPELSCFARFADELAGCPETAGGNQELMALEKLRPSLRPFEVLGYEVSTRQRTRGESLTRATVTIGFHGNVLTSTSEGVGPINALDRALRGCLATLYPILDTVTLTDYRVKVLERSQGTASRVRVAIDWTDGIRPWTTAGISGNVIEASWIALADSVRLELLRHAETDQTIAQLVTDESWAV